MSGKKIYSDNLAIGSLSLKIDPAIFKSGIYFATITDGNSTQTQKLVIE
ncbi:MAG: T9SS type A sorting domain-containing protein [Bacteroidetes bacterium]|nr:T9SS type A sorting domain-containing protein [Bacteroidota bacterium]